MSREIELGAVITDTFAIFDVDNITRVSGQTVFTTVILREGVPVSIPVTIAEIGTSGEYKVTFTPTSTGYWKVQVYSAYDEVWREVSVDIISRDSVAQVNVSFDDSIPRIYFEVWLERTNRPVAFVDLVSCEVTAYDLSGLEMFTETSSSAKDTGHFSLSHDIGLASNRPYNILVTVVDSIGSITSLHGISTVG
jgi:hypothetical protein